MSDKAPIVFILSYNRPLYLWACLDSVNRATRSPCRFVIADNASSDPLTREVIEGFNRRSMFHAVHLFDDNDPFRFKQLVASYWDDIGESFVFLEGDAAVIDPGRCWLEIMSGHLAAKDVASVGSRVDQADFVDPAEARALEPDISDKQLDFLIKRNAPMRAYRHTDAPLVEPHNPPLRLLMIKKSTWPLVTFANDAGLYRQWRALGWRCPISTQVVHRHLSLLNIYDYPDYSEKLRDKYFAPVMAEGNLDRR